MIDPRQPRILSATLAVVGLLACGFGNRDGSAGAERQPDAALPDPCTLLTPEEVEDIPGLGDAAFIGASVLHVRKGELVITLFVGSPTAEEEKAKAVKLAPKALARL